MNRHEKGKERKRRGVSLLFFAWILMIFWISVPDTVKAAEEQTEHPFFQWETELSEEQKEDLSKNFIYKASAWQQVTNESNGFLHLLLTGTSNNLIEQVNVTEQDQEYIITFPQAEYLLENKEFSSWNDILSGFTITATEDGSVIIRISPKAELEFSCLFQENAVEFVFAYHITFVPPDAIRKYALNILKPQGLTIKSVSNEDCYENNKFKIILKGNHVAFFKRNPITKNNKKIKKISVAKSGKNTVITVTTSSLQGYKIYEKGDYFVVKTGTPRKIYSFIYVLDAGHGGKDSGAMAYGMKEKNLNYTIIYTLMKQYFSDNAPDIKVYWTRRTDKFITLANRAAFAKKVGADVFISLHMNYAARRAANGTEVYYSTANNKSGFDGITSKKMASLFKKRLVSDLSMNNRGIKSAGFYVIKHNTVPAILIELGFISGSKDHKKLKKASFQKKAAKSIYQGMIDLYDNYDTGR